ncbi:hypothetical protein [Lysobacter gummosus]|uniref:hypothetical protein n=1 Tax=Lysobacter gummosus TaxID=262324 RepID=UPI0036457BFA
MGSPRSGAQCTRCGGGAPGPTRPGPNAWRSGVRGRASQWLASGVRSPRLREKVPRRGG